MAPILDGFRIAYKNVNCGEKVKLTKSEFGDALITKGELKRPGNLAGKLP